MQVRYFRAHDADWPLACLEIVLQHVFCNYRVLFSKNLAEHIYDLIQCTHGLHILLSAMIGRSIKSKFSRRAYRVDFVLRGTKSLFIDIQYCISIKRYIRQSLEKRGLFFLNID